MARRSSGSSATKKPDEYDFGTLLLRRGSAVHRLLSCNDSEILLEGPAGTGKTRGILEKIYMLASDYPGSRYLICRKARSTMPESVLVTLERDVFPQNHEAMQRRVSRTHRHAYVFANGSEIIVGGLDDISKTFSSEYDLICVFEAIEASENDWEFLQRSLRSNVLPWQQIIADTNPGAAFHWLNQRANTTRMTRLKAVFEDNPTITEDYLLKLRNLTGIRRKRLYEGKWVSAEGQIWENFDPDRHVISARLSDDGHGHWTLNVPAWDTDIPLRWFFTSVDWGFRNPGSMLTFGVDADRRAFLVHEIYRCSENIDWWTDRAVELNDRFGIQRYECDPSRPDSIDQFNERMGRKGDYWIADGAANDFLVGSITVRERFDSDSLFIVAGSLEHIDRWRKEAMQPCCLLDEIPSYVYRVSKDGQGVKEEPTIDSEDHACDALRYGMMFLDHNDWDFKDPIQQYKPGTFGFIMDHASVFDTDDGDEYE